VIPLTGTVVINGETFTYTLTRTNAVEGQGAPAPVPVPFMPRSRGEEIHTVQILTHQLKNGIATKGPMQGKPYEMHTFRGSDNRNYVTFKPEIAAKLNSIVGRSEPVKIVGTRDDRGGVRIIDVIA